MTKVTQALSVMVTNAYRHRSIELRVESKEEAVNSKQ